MLVVEDCIARDPLFCCSKYTCIVYNYGPLSGICLQAGLITGQSVIVGYLAEYFFSLRDEAKAFNITDNSTVNGQLSGNQTTHNEDMRNAYLLATGHVYYCIEVLCYC